MVHSSIIKAKRRILMNIKPLYDRVILKVIEIDNQTKSGIFIPETVKEKPNIGEVIAIGEGKICDNGSVIEPRVDVGNHVLFAKYAGIDIKIDDCEYIVIKESDILAITW
jgi:chaperonin GroES